MRPKHPEVAIFAVSVSYIASILKQEIYSLRQSIVLLHEEPYKETNNHFLVPLCQFDICRMFYDSVSNLLQAANHASYTAGREMLISAQTCLNASRISCNKCSNWTKSSFLVVLFDVTCFESTFLLTPSHSRPLLLYGNP